MLITFGQHSSHIWAPVDGQYYGADVTLDVYGFDLQPGQVSTAAIWIIDGSSHTSIEAGWHVSYVDPDFKLLKMTMFFLHMLIIN